MKDPLNISHEVSCALNRGAAVVALESSLIAHGLPAPVNVETALAMEQEVRDAGALPATIGVIDGEIRIGLTVEEIQKLGDGGSAKLAVRDLPNACTTGIDGGVTVSATVRAAAAAGITVMATGGIGGVHRGSSTADVSADLWEMTGTPIAIVCSGPKAILDVPATIEWLESHSVPIYGYKTDTLPAFYTAKSEINVPEMSGVDQLAEVIKMTFGALGMRSSVLIAVPVPQSDDVDLSAQIEEAIRQADAEAITGKQMTPWILAKIAELSNGRSVASNVALLKNNARIAARLACALHGNERPRMGFYA